MKTLKELRSLDGGHAGAAMDPLIGGIDGLGQFLIGDGAFRQVTAAPQQNRTEHGHEAAPPIERDAGLARAWLWMVSPILASN